MELKQYLLFIILLIDIYIVFYLKDLLEIILTDYINIKWKIIYILKFSIYMCFVIFNLFILIDYLPDFNINLSLFI